MYTTTSSLFPIPHSAFPIPNFQVLMSPELHSLVHHCSVDVPLNPPRPGVRKGPHSSGSSSGSGARLALPVDAWGEGEVAAWLLTTQRGRFAHVVLPPGIDGPGLLLLSATNMADLFAQQFRGRRAEGRGAGEGRAWLETAEETAGGVRALGRALWTALKRETQSNLARASVSLEREGKSKVGCSVMNGFAL
jgi:hypothetical protein